MTDKRDFFHLIDTILMEEEKPSLHLTELLKDGMFYEYPFHMISSLKKTPQSPKYHPEGDAFIHTVMVVDEAAKCKFESVDAHVFMWAALLHDIGKVKTTRVKKDKITSYEHEKVGAELAKEFLIVFVSDRMFIDHVAALVRWHMQLLFVVNNLPFKEIQEMKEEVDIKDVGLLGLCDRLGRLNADKEKEKEAVQTFLDIVNNL